MATPKYGSVHNVLPGPRGGDLPTEKKWSVRQSILFAFVMSVVLWALIILGVRQIF